MGTSFYVARVNPPPNWKTEHKEEDYRRGFGNRRQSNGPIGTISVVDLISRNQVPLIQSGEKPRPRRVVGDRIGVSDGKIAGGYKVQY